MGPVEFGHHVSELGYIIAPVLPQCVEFAEYYGGQIYWKKCGRRDQFVFYYPRKACYMYEMSAVSIINTVTFDDPKDLVDYLTALTRLT